MRPMLAAKAEIKDVRFPCYVSQKLDGIRAIVRNGVVVSRSLKPIRNAYVQSLFGRDALNGLDGELIVGDPFAKDCFRKTDSAVMSFAGESDVTFYVFDMVLEGMPFEERHTLLRRFAEGEFRVVVLDQYIVTERERLEVLESEMVSKGAEGLIVRAPEHVYKFGRSTLREGGMLKLKRFSDSEAVIIGFEEMQGNANEAEINDLGLQFRSKNASGMFGKNMLGALIVKDCASGVEFNIGTGFDEVLRKDIWDLRDSMLGRTVRYKYFDHGVKDKPRHPVFQEFRSAEDMG